MKRIDAMRGITSGLEVWSEPVIFPTYEPGQPDPHPMYLDKRVYQGSTGKVYPLPFIDRVSSQRVDKVYEAIHLENEFVYLMILPEIGGRIHIGYDKKANYDFFYRQEVIKPALVGLAGPWISGGVEFNWPQHHRPATYMPCAWEIQKGPDDSITVWLSDHDPMTHMKGMHGVCLRPDSTLIELKAQLFNRTPFVQTFLWWANVAARVHEGYQSFFPPDVSFVADHAKRAMSAFPACQTSYYGVQYGRRVSEGIPAEQWPASYPPQASYGPNRLDWYANIPVPTSYMVVSTQHGFFGGYDHHADAGFIHVADRHISPGKKQWTWGNHEFGYAWDRSLTDEGGPYVELMAGVYTDNQPDFSFLAPYETKTFSQFWAPIREIGPVIAASDLLALGLKEGEKGWQIGLQSTSLLLDVMVEVELLQTSIIEKLELRPGEPCFIHAEGEILGVWVRAEGRHVLEYQRPDDSIDPDLPSPATEPPPASEIVGNDELYLTGLHLDQYRHATRSPEPYWEEALRRDPGDSRCLTALGKRRLGQGLYLEAEALLKRAISRLTFRNPNPQNGEAFYHLGLTLEHLGRDEEAGASYRKAAWNFEWKAAGLYRSALICCRKGNLKGALALLDEAMDSMGWHPNALCAKAQVLRRLGRETEAEELIVWLLKRDPLNVWALFLASETDLSMGEKLRSALGSDSQRWIDLSLDLRESAGGSGSVLVQSPMTPMVSALLKHWGFSGETGRTVQPGHFPSRLEELDILMNAFETGKCSSEEARLLGFLLYDKKRPLEAVEAWKRALELDPADGLSWRCLGIAFYNVLGDSQAARDAYERAFLARPNDARVLYERDQLWKKCGESPEKRLAELESREDLVSSRDDLSIEHASLLCQVGEPESALKALLARRFSPWEGGEGAALGLHDRCSLILAAQEMVEGRCKDAVLRLEQALTPPVSLGESRHVLANASEIWLAYGDALKGCGRSEEAAEWWRKAADFEGDFQEMAVMAWSELSFFKGIALRRLGREQEAKDLFAGLEAHADHLESSPAKTDYFATSLPTLLLFDDDLQERQTQRARLMRAMAWIGLGRNREAVEVLQSLLTKDPSHARACDLLRGLDQG